MIWDRLLVVEHAWNRFSVQDRGISALKTRLSSPPYRNGLMRAPWNPTLYPLKICSRTVMKYTYHPKKTSSFITATHCEDRRTIPLSPNHDSGFMILRGFSMGFTIMTPSEIFSDLIRCLFHKYLLKKKKLNLVGINEGNRSRK